jgi:ribokinase
MDPLPRIAVLGSLNIDLVSYVPHHPLPGETLTATSFSLSPGGKGANQAVACAKLSRARGASSSQDAGATAHVSMVGCVGDDSYGTVLRENLATHGVDVSGVEVRAGTKTGVAIIVVDAPTGQNRIILSPEANHVLLPTDFADRTALETRLGGTLPDLLIMQLEIPINTVLAALRAAKDAGVPIMLNPAPAVPLPDEVFCGLAYLVVNETEAAILGGVEESVLDTEEGLSRVALRFIEMGVENVIITLGGRGVYFLAGNTKLSGLVAAEKAKVVDTTAAGDTFVGQFALEVVAARGADFDVATAVRKANKAAARTVEKLGAQDSIPWRDELE